MAPEMHTKVVLTVLAAFLVTRVVRGTPLVGTAHPEGDKVLAVDIVKVSGFPLSGNHALPVDVLRAGGSFVSGALPVKNN
jgi:hypothetical protein